MTDSTPVHVQFVIDSSGSMAGKATDVREGFNSYTADLRADPNFTQYRLGAVRFDTRVETLFTDQPLTHVPLLDRMNYRTGGNTALYDALGVSIDELTSAVKSPGHPFGSDRVIVIVMTDGEENSSHRFTKEQIVERIAEREAAGNWTFVYMGADQDAWAASQALGFSRGNTLDYAGGQTQAAFANVSAGTVAFTASGTASTPAFHSWR